ncbi:hypothetical protein N7520_011183 [Penicillium odoratum]|uniref:uncharacterized protein n=1 Tax=Penicillium odoratum TaxID=1167516 RepID=UPI0025466DE4|nr:uncharacterized protein N7520_011183 [Penicillium odoratum]KAJ5746001.1 hypothetical protein N7520_011183 [Penicillium odoratum]
MAPSGTVESRACFNTFTFSVSSDVQNLFHRVQQLEDVLSRIDSTPDSACRDVSNPEKSTPPGLPTMTSGRERNTVTASSLCSTNLTQRPANSCGYLSKDCKAKDHRSATQWGPNWYFNGISMSSEAGRRWVSTRTGQAVTWADFSIPIIESSPPSALQPPFSPELCELPDRDVTREIISAFFRSGFILRFPVLDDILFETTMETAYGPANGPLSSPIQVSARACVLSALSIASRVNPSRQISRSMDVDLYAAKAHYLLLHIVEDTSLSTLQTALVLQIQHAFHADWQGATFFQSIACRIVCALRGHLYHLSDPVGLQSSRLERENYHTRMLFWLCYMLDKDISIRTGSPPLLTDVYCELDLPDNYFDHYTYLPDLDTSIAGDDETHKYLTPHLPGDPRLSHLKEKVCRQLLSARASKNNDNQLLLNIRQLDDEIEHWRLSIPFNFRPALSVSKITSPNASDEGMPYIIHQMSLQLDYLYLITVIHTTVRKCTIEASDEIPDLHSVVHSSFDLSLMASRSTLWCLRILVSTVGEDAFRFVTLYSSTAALSLFLNIVIHPLDSQSRLDLELLISAVNMIRNIPVRALTQGEITRVQETGSFVMRLVWLGTCAVTKAEKEECDLS